ncbi:hypothetical protein BH20BAC1_BH20BAC1_25250 [soil metagenome]
MNENAEPVQGLTVHILNTNLAVASDANGLYIFDKITPGNYATIFRCGFLWH